MVNITGLNPMELLLMMDIIKVKGVYYVFDKYARRVAPGKKAVVKVNGVKYSLMQKEELLPDGMN